MKSLIVLFFVSFFCGPLSVQAAYSCHKLIDEDGGVGPALVSLQALMKDSNSRLVTLRSPFFMEGATFIKYQYWASAGDNTHMVQFIGVNDLLDDDGLPTIAIQNLFCIDDGTVEEGGL